jgi:hypothetical protein
MKSEKQIRELIEDEKDFSEYILMRYNYYLKTDMSKANIYFIINANIESKIKTLEEVLA